MRRRRTLAAAGVLAGATLAACGGDQDADPAATAAATDTEEHGGHAETSPVSDGARRIQVSGTSFAFDPAEIRVTAGEDVAIALTSRDILHDFTVEGLDVHVAAEADETAQGGLRAEVPGRYTYYCTVPGHREAGMEGTLVVESP